MFKYVANLRRTGTNHAGVEQVGLGFTATLHVEMLSVKVVVP